MTDLVSQLVGALEFYADPLRYSGPNQRSVPGDKHTPDGAPYMVDVTRDGGQIARAALTAAKAVSDEQIEEIARGKSNHIEFARAIPALRPQAMPMPEPVKRLSRYAGQTMRTARNPNITAREAIEIGDYLAAIGITAQGAQGGEG